MPERRGLGIPPPDLFCSKQKIHPPPIVSETLRLHPAVNLTFIDANRVQIRALSDQVTVNKGARLIAALVPLCDGSRSEREINEALESEGHDNANIRAAVQFFRSRGYFHSCADPETNDSFAAQIDWLAAKLPENRFDNRLAHRHPSQVTVLIPTQGILSEKAASVLRETGFRICRDPQSARPDNLVCLYATDWDDHASALSHNRANISDRVPTLYATLGENKARLGPFVLLGETPCYECFHHRMRSSMTFVDEFDRRVGLNIDDALAGSLCNAQPPRLYASVLAGLVTSELLKYVSKLTQLSLLGRILEVDLLRYQMEPGRVLRLPRCHACGNGKAHGAPTTAVRDLL